MAWVKETPAGRYAGKYRDAAGRTRTAPGGPFTHKAAAMRAAADAESKSRSAGWRDPDASRQPWSAWCEHWWPTRDVEVSTLKTDTGRRDKHLMPKWGHVALADIRRQDVRAWAAELRTGGLSPATVERCVSLLSGSLRAAVDAEILAANPAARLRLGGGSPAPERYLTRDEVAAIFDHLKDEHLAMAQLLLYTGMRWGEAAGLHAARIDRERGMVMVAEVWSTKGHVMKAYPKGRRQREVPLPEWVELPERRGGSCGYEHKGSRCRGALAIVNAEGSVVDDSLFRKVFTTAAKRAGVGHVRVHDLRHTYASWLLQSGVSLAEVGRLLGHVSPATTQRYAHLAAPPSEDVLQALRPTDRQSRGRGRAANGPHAGAEQGYAGLRLVKGGKS